MNSSYAILPSIPLQADSSFGSDTRPLELVNLGSPATAVMTDFRSVTPVTIDPEARIDTALKKMKTVGVRLLFVVGDRFRIVGLITANDIQGERPIKYTQQARVARADLTVAAIMTPQRDIQVLDAARVQTATVGDIIATLHGLERQHALVARIDPAAKTHAVVGMFSTSQISKLLGRDVLQGPAAANSLAEIVKKIG